MYFCYFILNNWSYCEKYLILLIVLLFVSINSEFD